MMKENGQSNLCGLLTGVKNNLSQFYFIRGFQQFLFNKLFWKFKFN